MTLKGWRVVKPQHNQYLMDQSEKSVIISRVHCKEKKSYGLVVLGDG